LTITCLVILNIIAFLYNEIAVVISIIGATSAIFLMFVVPILIYVKENDKKLSMAWKMIYYSILCSTCLIGAIHIIILIVQSITG